MKNIFFIIFFLCNLVAFSQTRYEALTAMRKEIAMRSKDLPIDFGFITLQKIAIEGNNYVFYYEVDEEQQDFDSYVFNLKNNSEKLFSLVGTNHHEQAKLFVISQLSIKLVAISKQTQKKEIIFLPASKIKEAYDKSKYSSKDLLMDAIIELRKELPEDWGNGLVLTSIDLVENYICYRIKTDETYLTMPLLRDYIEDDTDMIESLIDGMNETENPVEKLFLKYLKQSGMGLKYIIWSEQSADNVIFTITPTMIKKYIKDH